MTYTKSFSIFFIIISLLVLFGFNSVDQPISKLNSKKMKRLASGAFFQKTSCWFENTKHLLECGWLHTAPIKGSTESKFQLPVVIFRYQGNDKKDDPVIFLSGGPGTGSWLDEKSINRYWQNLWETQLSSLQRDVVLFDQRGSGLSRPKVYCSAYQKHTIKLLTQPDTPQKNALHYKKITQACWNQLKQQGIAMSQLATHYSANDVADIMSALDYQYWNIQGVSYGTRLGIEVQRRYPDQVHTLTLDSAYPPNAHLFQDWPMLLNQSLQHIFDQCQYNEQCTITEVEFEKKFWQLIHRLKYNPLKVTVNNAEFELDEVTVNDETLLAVLFRASYQKNILKHLNDVLLALYDNDVSLLPSIVNKYVKNQLDSSSSDAVYWAVECHDNPPIDTQKYTNAESDPRYHRLKYYLPEESDVCEIWNKDYEYIALNTQNTQNKTFKPVLIFSGEDDPITPTDWAIDAAAAFENRAYLFSFYNISHPVMGYKPCAYALYRNFLNNPDKRPRADCRFSEEITSSRGLNDKPRKSQYSALHK
jgi:pimeloyl-ACP methyl ester carboxylesterase